MRGAALLLTATLIHCQQHVLALKCYSCIDLENFHKCVITSCSGSQPVCYTGNLTMDLGHGASMKLHHKGCAPSCESTNAIMQQFSQHPDAQISKLMPNFELLTPNIQLQIQNCCQQDLCNGGAQGAHSLGALAAGLLLSLGVALLCTHL